MNMHMDIKTEYTAPTDELLMLSDAIEKWAQGRLSVSVLRDYRDNRESRGNDPEIWRELADFGLPGALIPEEHGGNGVGFEALGRAIEILGRSLAPTPLLASGLVATATLLAGGTEAQKAVLLPKLAGGSTIATLAHEENSRHNPAPKALLLTEGNGTITLNGRKIAVPEGLSADVILVSGIYASGTKVGQTALVIVEVDQAGLTRHQRRQVDSREYADLSFDNVTVSSACVLSGEVNGAALLDYALDCLRIGLSLEMIGGAEQAFSVTLDYLKTRVQFGQLIGSFQALQHRAAELYSRLSVARYCIRSAMQALDNNRNDVPMLASLAKATAGETFNFVASEMIQLHGGIGMTDDLDAGFYLKRSRVADALGGNQAFHRERYAHIGGW